LNFAAGLYRVQGKSAERIASHSREKPLTGRLPEDAEALLPAIAPVLDFAARSGPEPLAEAARARSKDADSTARTRLTGYWSGDAAAGDYLSRAILRPYAVVLKALRIEPGRQRVKGRCPSCGGSPWISARREGSLTEGARRMLGCALCGGEWLFERILCPACFEEDPRKLPSFRDEKYPAVRIEACETCRRYVKSIDLSEDARPIPEVDDLVSIAMDLWAAGEDYSRIEPGLAGI
jgi:FdhE protein